MPTALQTFDQKVYSDFSGGYNDTSAAVSIDDNQLSLSENVDYAAEVKALRTRKGCTKVNSTSFGYDVTDGYAWLIGSVHKKCIVMNSKLYDINTDTGEVTEKITLTAGATHIYPYIMYNTLFFGDGSELYSWGQFDYGSELGSYEIKENDIVKCNNSTLGLKGHFYKFILTTAETIDLTTENYTDTTRWTDSTDVENFSSSVVRVLRPYDPSVKEVVSISVNNSSDKSGTVSLSLDGVTNTFTVTAGASVDTILTSLNATAFDGWTSEIKSNAVIFTSTEAKTRVTGYIDPATTGISFTYSTVEEGKGNDCEIGDVKKCTIFCVHQGSARVFAAGNPDDNALYYSEMGQGNYFKATINKLYPAINGFGKVTAMANLSTSLIISYENGWYTWSGITPLTDAEWEPLNIPYGCVNNRTLCLTPNSFTFLSRDGIYRVSAAILNDSYLLLQTKQIITKLSENTVEKTIASISNTSLCDAIFYADTYLLAYSTNGTYCDRVLKYEWSEGSFTLITGWEINRWLNDHDAVFFASNNFVLKAFVGYSDIDTDTGEVKAIALHAKTKEYSFDTPQTDKVVQMIGFIFQQQKILESNVSIIVHAGYQKHKILNQDLAESLYWGRQWGKKWGYREAIVKVAEIVMVSNVFQVEIINNNIDDPITLIGVGFSYADTDLTLPTILKDEELMK